ncbi:unnamed protein product, partial [Prorocentrum cordatum]
PIVRQPEHMREQAPPFQPQQPQQRAAPPVIEVQSQTQRAQLSALDIAQAAQHIDNACKKAVDGFPVAQEIDITNQIIEVLQARIQAADQIPEEEFHAIQDMIDRVKAIQSSADPE